VTDPSRPLVAVLDYGIGNLRSAQKAFEHAGADARLTDDRSLIADADAVVLPGVGAFGACMDALRGAGLDELTIDVALGAVAVLVSILPPRLTETSKPPPLPPTHSLPKRTAFAARSSASAAVAHLSRAPSLLPSIASSIFARTTPLPTLPFPRSIGPPRTVPPNTLSPLRTSLPSSARPSPPSAPPSVSYLKTSLPNPSALGAPCPFSSPASTPISSA
jgi:hypothetical protein